MLLASAELYVRAQDGSRTMQFITGGVLAITAVLTMMGELGAVMFT